MNVRRSGKLRGYLPLYTVHVFEATDSVVTCELRLNGRGIGAGIAGIERRKIVHHTDIGNDHVQIIRRYGMPNKILHSPHILVCDFDASACGRLEVNGELTGVGLGKESQAQERIDCQAYYEHSCQRYYSPSRPPQRPANGAFIEI